jgi:glucokinase
MIIAGDIGGTKTNLALFEEREGNYAYSHLATYPSKNYRDLKTIVVEFLESCKPMYETATLHTACFAVAGPIVGGVCRATNLPWVIDSAELSKALNIPNIYLLNDLEANAWAIEILSADNVFELYPGKGKIFGNRAVISPGTGLGEAGLYWDGKIHHPFAGEGGHCEFGPRDELQNEFCRYLQYKFGHPSYERILSGPGLVNIYQFFKEKKGKKEENWLSEELKLSDPAKVITQNALNHKSEICVTSLNLFVSILGSEAGNCALKFMATGGVYLGGGIPPKILPKLKESSFFANFVDKGRLRNVLEAIPVRVILDDKASLKGAAHYCRLRLSSGRLSSVV